MGKFQRKIWRIGRGPADVTIPSTHSQFEAVRLPWLSGGLTLIFTIIFFVVPAVPDPQPHDPRAALENAFGFWQTHGYLEPDPRIIEFAKSHFGHERESLALAAVHELGRRAMPEHSELRQSDQLHLDELSESAFADPSTLNPIPKSHPLREFGFTPAAPTALAAISHVFLHAGWIHFISVLVLFLVLAARAESQWGPAALGRFLIASTLVATFSCWLFESTSPMTWVGACGPVAALFAAHLFENRMQPVRFDAPARKSGGEPIASIEIPALAIPLVWMIATIAQLAWLDTIGVSVSLAIAAIAGGLCCGACAGIMMQRHAIASALFDVGSQPAKRSGRARPRSFFEPSPDATDSSDVALHQLALQAESNPHDCELTERYWDAAVVLGRAEMAASVLVQQIERLARNNDSTRAAQLWRKLFDQLPHHRLHANELVRIVPALRQLGDTERSRAALRQAVAAPPREVGVRLALRIVELAKELDPKTALAAARRALEFADLHETKRIRIAAMVRELDPNFVAPTSPAAPALEPRPQRPGHTPAPEPERPAPNIVVPIQPTSTQPNHDIRVQTSPVVGVSDLAALPRFDAIQAVSAIPTELREDVLYFELENGRRAKVRYEQIEAIAVAALRDVASKPVVVADLLLNWSELTDAPLRSIRLRSDRYNPARLIRPMNSPTETLQAFLAQLLERTGATPLPDLESAQGKPFRVYKFLRAYQRQVLKVDC